MMASSDSVDPSVGFLYRDRDPKKRQVKPVQKHLLQVDFGEDDSEDDSDFQVDANPDSSEEEVADAENEDEIEKDQKSEDDGGDEEEKNDNDNDDDDDENDGSESDSSEGSDESEEDDRPSSSGSDSSEPGCKTQDMLISWGDDNSEDDEDYVPPDQRTDSKPPTPAGTTEAVPHRKEDIKISGEFVKTVTPGKKLKIVICQVCLGDISVEEDEIVECDGCGVSVHEGCYGISENQSAASTESSASTEPWFCDACKAGIDNPHCELCPNLGGIFKETDAGKWVHIVCALYIPGVAFGDVDKLSPVTLFEMSYTKWGAKECCLCEDIKFSRTGVCVGCDAGMCRTHFHVTCAQREGLLSEASPDEDIADPFYAYCKQHAEKQIARKKRCNWLALQRNIKNHPKMEIDDEKERGRVHRKLKRHCRKYVEYNAKKPPSWTPTEKMPRLLSSCPSALRRLNRKAELLGINTQLEQQSINKDTRKKSYVSPAFSVEYVTYFVERNNKISSMRNHTNELQQQHSKLREQEAILRAKYDQLSNEMTSLRNSNAALRQEGESFWKILGDAAGKSLPVPEVLKVKKLTVQTSLPRQLAKKDSPTSPNVGVILHKCSLCQKTSDQHMLARCDKCRLYYHLGCLDPPLTRMPKKTKQCGWQCSECAKTTSEESDNPDAHPDAPRKLRETIKEPSKFASQQDRRYRGLLESCKPKQKGKRKVRVHGDEEEESDDDMPLAKKKKEVEQKEPKVEKKKRLKKKIPKDKEGTTMKDKSTEGDKSTTTAPKRKRKAQVQPSYLFEASQQLKAPMECVICLKPGDTTNMVRCDECTLCYHYGCLDPPLTKSPKRRGYSWHCAACDPIGQASDYDDYDDSDDDNHEDKPKRKKTKKSPPTGKQSEQKGTKKSDGIRTRCKAKEHDGSDTGEVGPSGTEVKDKPRHEDKSFILEHEKLGMKIKTETVEKTSETKLSGKVDMKVKDVTTEAADEKSETKSSDMVDTIVKEVKTEDKSISAVKLENVGTHRTRAAVKPEVQDIKVESEARQCTVSDAPIDQGPEKAEINDSVVSVKDSLRSRTPTKGNGNGASPSGNGKGGVMGVKSGIKTRRSSSENEKGKNSVKKSDGVEEVGKVVKEMEKVPNDDGVVPKGNGKVTKDNDQVAKNDVKVDTNVAKDNGKVTKDSGKVAKDEDSGKKIDKIILKEVKIIVNRDLADQGVALKGKNGRQEEGGISQKVAEGSDKGDKNGKTKGVEKVGTRSTECDKVTTRGSEQDKGSPGKDVSSKGIEVERVSTRASGKTGNGKEGVDGTKQGATDKGKSPTSKGESAGSKEGGSKKDEGSTKERTPKKGGSPKQ